ncbi:MAG: NADH-quinone oxidoreductase subunit NuoG, partial [Bdellovibrionales bacterium]
MPKLTINNMEIEVEPGTSILQAAEMLGIEIPRFCYHDRLSVPANCRMCLVEMKGAPKPVASCAMAAGDGMEITTNSEVIQKARKGVMEMMLINHPLDCPICDQGGECDLQDQAYGYGFDRSRYRETKRAVKDKDLGPLVKTVMTRCIQCTRCVRFGEEVAGTADLGVLNRGEDAEIGTFVEKTVSSELSGNMIDICPVGALTSKPYAFNARPWELKKTESIDIHDAVGSNIRIDSRGGEVMRILPRLHEEINEEWISDKTRFAYDGLKKRRLDTPYVRNGETGKLEKASWEEALAKVAEALNATPADKIAAYAGDLADVESTVALKDLMKGLGVTNTECRTDGSKIDPSVRAGYIFNSGIQGVEEADAILLIGTNPRLEAPIVNARIRKTWLERHIPIAVIGEPADLTYPYHHAGTTAEDIVKLAKDYAKKVKSKKPMMIVGDQIFARSDGAAIHAALCDAGEKLGCVHSDESGDWNGFNILHRHAGRVGALDVGFVSETPIKTEEMDVLYLLNSDEESIISNCNKNAFVVYQGHHGDISAHRADVILPSAAYTEKNATYVNTAGRVQQTRQAVFPVGEAKEDWKIIRALSDTLGQPLAYDSLIQLRERIIREWDVLGELDVLIKAPWKEFGKKGKLLKAP